MDAPTQEITDKQRIRELQNHYAHSIDSSKYDNLDVMFTPDATYHFATGSTDNIGALKNTIRDTLSPVTIFQHINGNQWAEIEGDLANTDRNTEPQYPRVFSYRCYLLAAQFSRRVPQHQCASHPRSGRSRSIHRILRHRDRGGRCKDRRIQETSAVMNLLIGRA